MDDEPYPHPAGKRIRTGILTGDYVPFISSPQGLIWTFLRPLSGGDYTLFAIGITLSVSRIPRGDMKKGAKFSDNKFSKPRNITGLCFGWDVKSMCN